MGSAPSRRLIARAGDRVVRRMEALGLYPNGKRCLYCGTLLRDAADEHTLFVKLDAGYVFLHPACARQLGAFLLERSLGVDDDEEIRLARAEKGIAN
jgi:hypothetical protein